MRGVVADKRCDNGHFIDESWDLCPYCPAEKGSQEIPIVRPARFPESRPVAAPAPAPAPAHAPVSRAAPVSAPTPPPPEPRAVNAPSAVPRREPTPSPPPMERTIAVPKLNPDQQAKRYVVGWLIGLNGASRGESYPVRMGRNVLGRDRRSDIVVNDDQASSHHADLVFRPEEKRFILMDHNSTNGTYVNELEIEPRRDLILKDIIRIGSVRYVFMPLCQDGFYWDEEGGVLQ